MTRLSLISPHQHGFMKGRSCNTQLLTVLEHWTDILDNNTPIDVIYFDFKKAFDTVPHKRLLHKLKSYGIGGNVLNWIREFLTGRTQRVVVNNNTSTWAEVCSGVPQGSVLGPILFVLHINDLPDKVSSFIKLFAEDTKIYRPILNSSDIANIQKDIDEMVQWSKDWLLQYHPQKCSKLRLGPEQPGTTYHMADEHGTVTEIKESKSEKDLGVHIDNHLSFDDHIRLTVSKANKQLGLIRRAFEYLDAEMLGDLFKSRIHPILEYGNNVWNPRLKKHKDLIEGVQRRATKLIGSLRHLSYEERLRKLNLPTLCYRRKRGDMIEMYKFMNNKYDVDHTWIKMDNDNRTRGHNYKLKTQRCRTLNRQHTFGNTCRVTRPWNSLPQHIVEAPSLNSFKARLDKHWTDQKFSLLD